MFNKVILVGNCTRDIELRYTQGGSGIANTAVATSHKYTSNGEKKEEVCFTDITFFGKSAEIANQYLHKGSKVLVEGRLKFDQWVDQNGAKKSKHSVVVETMKMMDSKSDSQGQNQSAPKQAQSYQAPQQGYNENHPNAPQQQMPKNSNIPIETEQIPF